MDITDTYKRVCTRKEGHEGEHLPYYMTPDKDEFGNKDIQHPRCLHVVPIPIENEEERFRIVFEIIDPRYPEAGWHEVAKVHDTLDEAQDHKNGILQLQQEGDDVQFVRIERLVSRWELVPE